MQLVTKLRPDIERAGWSGDGDLTRNILDALAKMEEVAVVKVEDAPASRAEAGYNFLCNELFVGFRIRRHVAFRFIFGFLPVPSVRHRRSLTLSDLEDRLAGDGDIGPADYADAGMLQYLRAERQDVAYQRRGPKLVEMVRIYEARAEGGD